MAKTSLILTTKNEEDNIAPLLESIANQTYRPSQVVIVDALSKDKTTKIINSYKNELPIKLISKKCNRSEGRNLAIEKSNGEIIAVTDAGCILDKNWLRRITTPFNEHKIDIVSGYYKPLINNTLDELVYLYTSIVPNKLNKKRFLPSSRSVAFRKAVWKEVGGYPKNLQSSEDIYFDLKLKKNGKRFFTEEKAVVFWHPRSRNESIFKQFYVMAKSSAEGGIIKKTVYLQFARYLFGFILLISGYWNLLLVFIILYCSWSISKNYKSCTKGSSKLLLFPFQVYIDIIVMVGTISGLFKKCIKKPLS